MKVAKASKKMGKGGQGTMAMPKSSGSKSSKDKCFSFAKGKAIVG